jgi:hypothetical protein
LPVAEYAGKPIAPPAGIFMIKSLPSSLLLDKFFNQGEMPPNASVVERLKEIRERGGPYMPMFFQDTGMALQLLRAAAPLSHLSLSLIFEQTPREQILQIVDWAVNATPLPVELPGPDYYLFWRISLHRSVLMRQLANMVGMGRLSEELSIGAMLLESALPILLLCLSRQQQLDFPGFHASLHGIMAWSRLELGIDHRMLGRELFLRWQFPGLLVASQQPADAASPPDIKLMELARQAVESFYAANVELAEVQALGQEWFNLEPNLFNQAIVMSLNRLSEFSLAQMEQGELDDSWEMPAAE